MVGIHSESEAGLGYVVRPFPQTNRNTEKPTLFLQGNKHKKPNGRKKQLTDGDRPGM